MLWLLLMLCILNNKLFLERCTKIWHTQKGKKTYFVKTKIEEKNHTILGELQSINFVWSISYIFWNGVGKFQGRANCSLIWHSLLLLFFNFSVMSYFWTPWTEACQASLSFTISQSSLRLISIELMMPSNHLILCCSLLLLPSIFSSIRILSNESDLHIRWPKYWSFSFSISPFSEYSGLISFRIN